MQKQNFSFAGWVGKSLPAVLWQPETPPVGIVQITHGMTEHIARYAALAQALTDAGLIVAGYDLRGHGEDVVCPGIASFGADGWEASLQDMRCFYALLQQRWPGLPHHMLGFSLGSFLLREYLGRWPGGLASAAVLGTGQQPGAVLALIRMVVSTQLKKNGFDGTTDLVRQLSFGTYNKKFAPSRTPADWLCADTAELDAYRADPLCRADISAGLFYQLLGAMQRTGAADACASWDKNLPLLLLSGKDDPVGDAGKGVAAVQQQWKRAGIKTVSVELLAGARHDVLHEEAIGAAQQARDRLVRWFTKPM